MNRRSMLGMLGIGAASGPAIAEHLVSSSKSPNTFPTPAEFLVKQEAFDSIPRTLSPAEKLIELKHEYSVMTQDKPSWLADYISREYNEYRDGYSSIRLETIDPDIRNMRSISDSAKIRMAISRRANRKYEDSRFYLKNRIDELLRMI